MNRPESQQQRIDRAMSHNYNSCQPGTYEEQQAKLKPAAESPTKLANAKLIQNDSAVTTVLAELERVKQERDELKKLKFATEDDLQAVAGRKGTRLTAREMRLGRSLRSLEARARAYQQDNKLFRTQRDELLAALKNLIGKIEEMSGCMEVNYEQGHEECYPEFDAARAAIARAEGARCDWENYQEQCRQHYGNKVVK